MPCNKSSINNCCKVGRFPSLRVKSDDCSKVKCSVPVLKNPCSCVTCCGREAVVVQDDCKYSGACGKQVYGCIKPVCQHNPCSNLTSCHDHVVKTVIQDDCESWRRCGNEEFVSFPVNKWKCACCTPAHTMPCNKSSINNCCKVGRFPSLRVKSDDCSKVKCSVPVLKNPCSCVTCCGREAVVVQDDCKYSGACGKQVYGCFKPVCQHNPCSNLTSCHDHAFKTVIQDDCESWRRCGNEEFVSYPVNKWKCACCTSGCDQMPLQLTDRKL
ncbi:keratin-associated protein 4-8-like [Cyprinus carpio]|uniref:Keratin-associated protein 4-8-like n=1 Tax=Cyprinus carpio TaxID=7962 RepID=A0A9Q9ZQ02_CYPCA|nr:keratin-associated protein 4-8-like [Cyprinus carpio]